MMNNNTPNEFGHGLLHKAVIYNRRQDFFALYQAGYDIQEQDELGFTPIHLAVLLERNLILKDILTWKTENKIMFDVNVKSSKGTTSLHLAARNGNPNTSILLLKIGSNPNLLDDCGRTALDIAKKFRNFDCVRILSREEELRDSCFEDLDMNEDRVMKKRSLASIPAVSEECIYSAGKSRHANDDNEEFLKSPSLPSGREEFFYSAGKSSYLHDNEEKVLKSSSLPAGSEDCIYSAGKSCNLCNGNNKEEFLKSSPLPAGSEEFSYSARISSHLHDDGNEEEVLRISSIPAVSEECLLPAGKSSHLNVDDNGEEFLKSSLLPGYHSTFNLQSKLMNGLSDSILSNEMNHKVSSKETSPRAEKNCLKYHPRIADIDEKPGYEMDNEIFCAGDEFEMNENAKWQRSAVSKDYIYVENENDNSIVNRKPDNYSSYEYFMRGVERRTIAQQKFLSDSQINKTISKLRKLPKFRRYSFSSGASRVVLHNKCFCMKNDGESRKGIQVLSRSSKAKSSIELKHVEKCGASSVRNGEGQINVSCWIDEDNSNLGSNMKTHQKLLRQTSLDTTQLLSETTRLEKEVLGSNEGEHELTLNQKKRFIEIPVIRLCRDCHQSHKLRNISRENAKVVSRLETKMGANQSINSIEDEKAKNLDLWEIWDLTNPSTEPHHPSVILRQEKNLSGNRRCCSLPDLSQAHLQSDELKSRQEELNRSSLAAFKKVPCSPPRVNQHHNNAHSKTIDARVQTARDSRLLHEDKDGMRVEVESILLGDISDNRVGSHDRDGPNARHKPRDEDPSFGSYESHDGKVLYGSRKSHGDNSMYFSLDSSSFKDNTLSNKQFRNSLSSEISVPFQKNSVFFSESFEIHQSSSNHSPAFQKPYLPVIFCDKIYRSRSDSDLAVLAKNDYHPSFEQSKTFSLSISALNSCIRDDVIEYFPTSDGASTSLPLHECHDWSLCTEYDPPDKNHLTVSIKTTNDVEERQMAYTYICSEKEDLEGSFICSDCGSAIAQVSINKSSELQEENDEFFLVYYQQGDPENTSELIPDKLCDINFNNCSYLKEYEAVNENEYSSLSSQANEDSHLCELRKPLEVSIDDADVRQAVIVKNEQESDHVNVTDINCQYLINMPFNNGSIKKDESDFGEDISKNLLKNDHRNEEENQNHEVIDKDKVDVRSREFGDTKIDYNEIIEEKYSIDTLADIKNVNILDGTSKGSQNVNNLDEDKHLHDVPISSIARHTSTSQNSNALNHDTPSTSYSIIAMSSMTSVEQEGIALDSSDFFFNELVDDSNSESNRYTNNINNDHAYSTLTKSANPHTHQHYNGIPDEASYEDVDERLASVFNNAQERETSNLLYLANDDLELMSNDTGIDMDELSVTEFEDSSLDTNLFTSQSKDIKENESLLGARMNVFQEQAKTNNEVLSSVASRKEFNSLFQASVESNGELRASSPSSFPSPSAVTVDELTTRGKCRDNKKPQGQFECFIPHSSSELIVVDNASTLSKDHPRTSSNELDNSYTTSLESSSPMLGISKALQDVTENDRLPSNKEFTFDFNAGTNDYHRGDNRGTSVKKKREIHQTSSSSCFETRLLQSHQQPSETIEFQVVEEDERIFIRTWFFNFVKEEVSGANTGISELIKLQLLEVEARYRTTSMKCVNNVSAMKIVPNSEMHDHSSDLKNLLFLSSPRMFALLIIRIAECKELGEWQVVLAKFVSRVFTKKSISYLTMAINWLLVFFGLLKSEFGDKGIGYFNKSSVMLLLEQLITDNSFSLPHIRQLAFFFARSTRPSHLLASCRESRVRLLKRCFRMELKDAPFSSRYPFKIFMKVETLFSGISDDFETAYGVLDEYLAEYLHENNCISFVTDVLIYMGLLKSESPVDTSLNIHACLSLLNYTVTQDHIPTTAISLLLAFIEKPNCRLTECWVERQRLLDNLKKKKKTVQDVRD